MKKNFILAIDQGTTSSRAILFNKNGKILEIAQEEFPLYYPKPGWVEQNPIEIWDSVVSVVKQVLSRKNLNPESIKTIGITNQRETIVLWDKKTGTPVYNAIVWQSRQSAEISEDLKAQGKEDFIRNRTGLVIDAYFSASKLTWLFKEKPDLLTRAKAGELLFGTIDCWLLWKLTGGKVHATDFSNACRTLLFNIFEKKWDSELCKLFGIPKAILPEVKDSNAYFGETLKELFSHSIPITGILGDQQAALFGQCCFKPGEMKNTYGTGCFLLMNTGEKAPLNDKGLLTSIAWSINGVMNYCLEGSAFVAGAAVLWLRDGIELIESAEETEILALSVNSTEGVYVVPAFVGLGAPYWDSAARGSILGLTRGTIRAHIVRATLDSLAYQSRDLIDLMKKEIKAHPSKLRVDGGACANNYLMQFQSDILDLKVERPKQVESSALGAALMAGLGAGLWQNLDEISNMIEVEKSFEPKISNKEREKAYSGWKNAIQATRSFKP